MDNLLDANTHKKKKKNQKMTLSNSGQERCQASLGQLALLALSVDTEILSV